MAERFWLPARRLAAYLLDILLLFAALAPAGQLVQRTLGLAPPRTGPELARVIAWNFSLPAWLYFTFGDRSRDGMTPGKRLLRVRVRGRRGGRLGFPRALLRTALKLLPWELVHLFAFARSTDLTQFRPDQAAGVAVANALTLAYLAVAVASGGRRSVHDLVAGSCVEPVAEEGDGAR
ncbi:MAG TPA: RDD family protein [Chloroflexaceae bacterium]|nr:RDD family protein [Chloroflexaceae bacterium]